MRIWTVSLLLCISWLGGACDGKKDKERKKTEGSSPAEAEPLEPKENQSEIDQLNEQVDQLNQKLEEKNQELDNLTKEEEEKIAARKGSKASFEDYCKNLTPDDDAQEAQLQTLEILNQKFLGKKNLDCSLLFDQIAEVTLINLNNYDSDRPRSEIVRDLTPLSHFTWLRFIALNAHDVRSLAPLKEMPELNILWVSFNQNLTTIAAEDLPPSLHTIRLEGVAAAATLTRDNLTVIY